MAEPSKYYAVVDWLLATVSLPDHEADREISSNRLLEQIGLDDGHALADLIERYRLRVRPSSLLTSSDQLSILRYRGLSKLPSSLHLTSKKADDVVNSSNCYRGFLFDLMATRGATCSMERLSVFFRRFRTHPRQTVYAWMDYFAQYPQLRSVLAPSMAFVAEDDTTKGMRDHVDSLKAYVAERGY